MAEIEIICLETENSLYSYNTDYATIRGQNNADTVDYLSTIGQTRENVTHIHIWRGCLFFDTSPLEAILADKVITSAVLRLNKTTGGVFSSIADPTTQWLVIVDGADCSESGLLASDYGQLLDDTTDLGHITGTDWLAGSGDIDITLDAAGLDIILKTGYTKLALRGRHDIIGTVPTVGTVYRNRFDFKRPNYITEADRPRLIITYATEEVIGLFVRGDEIQAIFVSGGYRSPDFGGTWYEMEGEPAGVRKVGFDVRNVQNSFLVGDEVIQTFASGVGEVFYYEPGATISGVVSAVDVDIDSTFAVIGTDERLYKTINWGDSVKVLWEGDVDKVAIGGNTLAYYELPGDVSGIQLLVNGLDYIENVYTGHYLSDFKPYPLEEEEPASWSDYVRSPDDDKYIFSTWHHTEPKAVFLLQNVSSNYSDKLFNEVRVSTIAWRGTYPLWGIKNILKTHDTEYFSREFKTNQTPTLRSVTCCVNPFTGQPWTYSEINDLRAGVQASTTPTFSNQSIGQIYVEVFPGAGEGVGIVGSTPIERMSSHTPQYTTINRSNPATKSGVVRYIEIYVKSGTLQNVKVATFYKTGGSDPPSSGTYSTRGYYALPDISVGYHKFLVNLDIEIGDFIGIYATGGTIASDYGFVSTDQAIEVSTLGDYIPCTDETFIPVQATNKYIPSIRGIIF